MFPIMTEVDKMLADLLWELHEPQKLPPAHCCARDKRFHSDIRCQEHKFMVESKYSNSDKNNIEL